MVFITPNLTFPSEQGLLTRISFQFVIDDVVGEIDETFTITYTGVEGESVMFGSVIIPEFTGTILDVNSK
jgi:hypothetical protein